MPSINPTITNTNDERLPTYEEATTQPTLIQRQCTFTAWHHAQYPHMLTNLHKSHPRIKGESRYEFEARCGYLERTLRHEWNDLIEADMLKSQGKAVKDDSGKVKKGHKLREM